MTKLLCGLVLTVSLLNCLAVSATEQSERRVASEYRSTLNAFRSGQAHAHLEGKPELMVGFYAEGVRLMPAHQKTVLGKADAATYHRAFLKRFAVRTYDREAIEAADLGARIMEIGQFTMTLTAQGSSETHTLAGKYMDLWEKSADDSLRLNTAA